MTEYLTLKYHISEKYNMRCPNDLRKKCDQYIKEYEDISGIVYRKTFYTVCGVSPVIPKIATHTELNNLKYQL